MILISQDVWDKLAKPTGDSLVARIALPEITNDLLCALDSKDGRHLLIPLNTGNIEFKDKDSRGVSVDTRELTVHGQKTNKYLDLECLDASGYAIFDLMGGEIANSLTDKTKQPSVIVKHVLARWRRFWGQTPQSMLSREEQIGLFAELWFISMWLLPKLGANAVLAWRGPWRSRHDFEWEDKSVEVKATTNTRGHIHKIHGIDQLSNPTNGPLFLLSVRLHEERGAVNTLPKVIDSCRSQLVDSEDALSHFENALAQSGYSPFYEDEYAKFTLRIVEELLFKVDSDFPRLTPTKFSSSDLLGIERIDYEINLNTYDHLIVANCPEQMSI
jgi:hypothetical protein